MSGWEVHLPAVMFAVVSVLRSSRAAHAQGLQRCLGVLLRLAFKVAAIENASKPVEGVTEDLWRDRCLAHVIGLGMALFRGEGKEGRAMASSG